MRQADGIRFGCTRCSNCCRQPGYVWLTVDELAAMASHLRRSVEQFQQDFNVQWDSDAQSWRIDAIHGDGCPLLVGNDCSVHPVKPAQCRVFPFWSELLEDRDAWKEAKAYCPGMDAPDGRLFSAREIRKIRRKADVP